MKSKITHKLSLFLVVMILSLNLGFAQNSVQETFSLQQCLDYAISNHSKIKNAMLDAQIADLKVKETRGIGLPQISGKIDGYRNIAVQKQFVPANAFDSRAPANVVVPLGFGVDYSANAQLSVSQLLYDGSFITGLKASKKYKELYTKSVTQTEVDLKEAVTNAYYSVLVTQEQIKLIEININRLNELIRTTTVLKDNGFAENLDVQRLQVSYNNLMIEKEKIKTFIDLNYELLAFQMGMPEGSTVKLSDTLEQMTASLPAEQTSAATPEKRPEMDILQTQKELQLLNIKYQKMLRYPSAGAFINSGYNTGALNFGDVFKFNNWEPYMMIGVSVKVPLFSGFRSNYIIKQEQLKLEQLDNTIANTTDAISFETKQAQKTYNDKLKTLVFHKENIELAEQVFKSSEIKLKNGVGSNLELIDAESSLKEAQLNYTTALYDLLVAYTQLQKAQGNL